MSDRIASAALTRRQLLRTAAAACIASLAANTAAEETIAPSASSRRPNIIVYMTDEHRLDCIGAYGNTVIKTPNMDRLAASGVRFNNMFSQFPLCGPSRACFITGQYPQTHGVLFNGVPLPLHAPRLPRALKEVGYTTAQVGLYNIEPREGACHGFDIFRHQEREYPKWAAERGVTDIYPYGGNPRPNDFYGALDYPAEAHAATWVGDTALEVLEQIKEGPFYLEINERYPHLPYVAPQPYAGMYRPEDIPLAPSIDLAREDIKNIREMHAIYYGMITQVDDQFGRILDKVAALGLEDNTVIVFTADHGDMLGHHDLWSKWALYDDDARLPFIMRYPGQPPAGTVVDGLAEQIDLTPTLLELAGAAIPRGVQGKSLLLTADGRSQGKDAVFGYQGYGEYPAKIRAPRQMVRTRDWKLIHMPSTGSLLFDLKNDPYETRNLYGSPECAGVERELMERLLTWHLDAANTTIPSLFIPGQEKEAKEWIARYMHGEV